MFKAIFTDMDDTLIVNQALYDGAFSRLAEYLQPHDVCPKYLDETVKRIDASLFAELGFSPERIQRCFEMSLRHVLPHAGDDMITVARAFARSVFETIAAPLAGVAVTLPKLAEHFPVYIITQGDETVQKNRINHLPFKDALSGHYVVTRKDAAVYKQICADLGIAPHEAVMIGDSLKSDVLAAREAGLHAIYITKHADTSNWLSPTDKDRLSPPKETPVYASFAEAGAHILAIKGIAATAPRAFANAQRQAPSKKRLRR